MYGWAGQRLKVYLTEGRVVKEPLSEDLRLNFLGGRGLNSKLLFDELGRNVDPLGPDNITMLAVGPLNGTAAPASSRWTVSAKSAATGGLGDGNGGGDAATELKFAGYDQITFYGRASKPVYLWINGDQVELRDASHLWGLTTREIHQQLVKELGDREIREFCIGPAGENLVRFAKIFANVTRSGGKGGMGAVWGSKNLKAVAIRGTGSVRIAQPREFLQSARQCYEKLRDSLACQVRGREGTLQQMRLRSALYSLPTRNQQEGYFEGWEKLSIEAFEAQFAVKHKGCSACPISCSHYYRVSDGPYATHGESNEYGTTYPFGPKCGIDNLAAVLLMTTLCDQLGMDTHSCGGTISFAMECWQRGLLTARDTGNIDLSWGNADAVIKLLPMIAHRQGFGDLLAEGSEIASRQIKGSEVCLRTVKGLELSALYPGSGANTIEALAYATATRGPDHLRGGICRYATGLPRLRSALGSEEAVARLNVPRSYEGRGIFLSLDQDFCAFFNSLNVCDFVIGAGQGRGCLNPDELAGLVSTATGVEMTGDDLMRAGERISNVERAFNCREGMRRKDDTLPRSFFVEADSPWGPTGVNEAKFQTMLDEYYAFRGWDQDGIPTKSKLEEIGLGKIAGEIGAP